MEVPGLGGAGGRLFATDIKPERGAARLNYSAPYYESAVTAFSEFPPP